MTERTTMDTNAEGAYLREVGKRLRALTPAQRDAVLDDVRAHFADAADAGRSPEQAAESLGDPASFTERVRSELGHEPGRTDRMARALLWLATGTAVFTAMFVSFWHPDDSLQTVSTQFEVHGFGIVLWNLLPALITVLPILATPRARTVLTAAAAVALIVVSLTFFDGWAFAPALMLAVAALAVPATARDGRPATAWRITAGVCTALPALLSVVGVVAGSFEVDAWFVPLAAVSLGLGVLIALGRPWAGVVLAVGGAALLVWSALDPGYLVLATWWAGGLYLALGASHAVAHARPRPAGRD